MKFNFDLTTMEGRKSAIEQFSEALNEALKNEVLKKEMDDEEAVIIMYRDSEDTMIIKAGRSIEISELQAKCLARHPEILEPTLKMVPMMLMLNHLRGSDVE